MTQFVPASPSGSAAPPAPMPPESMPDRHVWGNGTSPGNPPSWGDTVDVECERPEALRVRSRSVADAALAEIAAPPCMVTQDGSTCDNPHRFHLALVLEGYGTYRWAGGSVMQRAGDIVLLDTAEPSRVVCPVNSRVLRWSFPEAFIAPFLPLQGSRRVFHLPAREGLMTVITRHALELAREAERLDPGVEHGLLTHLCGLLGLAIEAEATPCPARRRNYRAFQRQRVLAYIEAHLGDPRCTARRAAEDLGMSVRWLHALFEESAEGFAGLVTRRRLEKGLGLLRDPASDRLSIAEIAFLCGFNDLSTFYRRFGERYGTTPARARRARSPQPA